jgi:hypothetical protein
VAHSAHEGSCGDAGPGRRQTEVVAEVVGCGASWCGFDLPRCTRLPRR